MLLKVKPSSLHGKAQIPGSKSHTIRATVFATLAGGVSRLENPLISMDTASALEACRFFGAGINTEDKDCWRITGTGGEVKTPGDVINVGNSGTTLYIALPVAALSDGYTVFTGDAQILDRPAQPLLDAINKLGGTAISTPGNGKPPIIIKGRLQGGSFVLDGSKTSQYLTALLISCPLANGDTEIRVENAVERPYIEMTLSWLDKLGIRYERKGFEHFMIPGRQQYPPFSRRIPGDFSSATFFLCAAAVTGSELALSGLDMQDSQGDKAVIDMLKQMGAHIVEEKDVLVVKGGDLHGADLDLGDTPDALPAMAVTACFAKGATRLYNVGQARMKETDRISVMCRTLTAMGADVEELPDGLIIKESRLKGTSLHGYSDHRVVMALALAGLAAENETVIDTAEAIRITFPTFVNLMRSLGAEMSLEEEE